MKPIKVLIPSRSVSNLAVSVPAIRKLEPTADIIVIDDGVHWEQWPEPLVNPLPTIIPGMKPFIFARNVNAGIRYSVLEELQGFPAEDGWLIVNDDAVLTTPGGFSLMAEAARSSPELGIVGAATNLGHKNQHPKGNSLRLVLHFAYICFWLPRSTLDQVGFLDEQFNTYGYEDNDYSLRIHIAGLRAAVHDGCFVDHSKLRSTFRGDPRLPANLAPGKKHFLEKWKDRKDVYLWI